MAIPMMEHPSDLLEAYALHLLTPELAAMVEEHVASCALCQKHLQEAEALLSLVAYAAPEMSLPAGAEDRFMARVQAERSIVVQTAEHVLLRERSAETTYDQRTARRSLPLRIPRALPRIMVAAACIALIIGIMAFSLRRPPAETPLMIADRQVRAALQSAQPQVYHLVATAHGPANAVAALAIDPQSHQGAIVVRNVPALPVGSIYEFWIVHAGADGTTMTTPIGIFAVSTDGAGTLRFMVPTNLGTMHDAGISVEPQGGVQQPDSPMLLTLQSQT